MTRRSMPLVVLVAAACAGRSGTAIPVCERECGAVPDSAIVAEFELAPSRRAPVEQQRRVVTGEELDRIVATERLSRPQGPAIVLARVDSTGRPRELRLERSTGVSAVDRSILQDLAGARFDLGEAGWYRLTVRPAEGIR